MARALLKNAPILIFDEATASIDAESEAQIQDALDRLVSKRTMIVIAHRLSTIRRASQILVLRAGEIVERGTHAQLISANGTFAELCRIQNLTAIDDPFAGLPCGSQ